MLVDAQSEGSRYRHNGESLCCAQAVCVGFGDFSTADIPVTVELVFCISVFVWNACGCSRLSYFPLAAE